MALYRRKFVVAGPNKLSCPEKRSEFVCHAKV